MFKRILYIKIMMKRILVQGSKAIVVIERYIVLANLNNNNLSKKCIIILMFKTLILRILYIGLRN